MFLGDFHVHSNFSDGALSIPELVDFYGQRGFGAIAITDHVCEERTFLGKAAFLLKKSLRREQFQDYLRVLREQGERALQQYKMIVIPGVELTKNSLSNHRSAHIVALDVREWISADQDIEDILRAIKSQGALSIAAHPVYTGKMEAQTFHLWDRRAEFADLFDAWEVASGPRLFPEVVGTRLPKIASSDLHLPKQINAWKTKLFCELHPEAVLRAIQKQDLDVAFYQDRAPNFGFSPFKALAAHTR
jgi:hypothetical protein